MSHRENTNLESTKEGKGRGQVKDALGSFANLEEYIQNRAIEVARHILDTHGTVREAAIVFKVSKSTVHKDVTKRLPQINSVLAEKVKVVLDKNKEERHLRGGNATREKYKKIVI